MRILSVLRTCKVPFLQGRMCAVRVCKGRKIAQRCFLYVNSDKPCAECFPLLFERSDVTCYGALADSSEAASFSSERL
jgi:hypothetical protein